MDDERDTTNQPLPGTVSNQNGEEAEPGQDGGGGGEAQRKPSDTDEHSSGGDSSEGSQSTGDPRSAG